MTRTVLLDTIAHADLRVAIGYSAAFGDAINQCIAFPAEIDDLQREYPIVLRRDADGDYYAVVLLGLDRDENLFLEADGWHARHVPAVRQCGAFRVGMVERAHDGVAHNEAMLHVDLDHPRIGAADGQAVFLPHGGHSPYLEHIVRVLQVVHDGAQDSAAMAAAFVAADLIEPVTLDIALDDTTRYTVPECYTIDAARLARLDDAALGTLNRSGFLRHAVLIAGSLGNVARLIDRKNRKRHGMPSGTAVAA